MNLFLKIFWIQILLEDFEGLDEDLIEDLEDLRSYQ